VYSCEHPVFRPQHFLVYTSLDSQIWENTSAIVDPAASSQSAMSTTRAAASAMATVVKAPPQGGVLEGGNPVHFDPKNPIILFIIQVCRQCCHTLYLAA
jgi:hypothetical protein